MIVELKIENVKRIKAAHISPPPGAVVIGGRNAQGKSSVLDSIAMALGGKREIPERPIRDGADRAEVEVVLDNGLRIKRVMTAGGERLVVQSADGAKYSSPQAMLDAMLGSACLDPVRFARADHKEQSRILREAAKLDLDAIDREIAECEAVRRDAAKAHKAAEAASDACPVPDEIPHAVDVTALIAARDAALNEQRHRRQYEGSIASLKNEVSKLRAEIDKMKNVISDKESQIDQCNQCVSDYEGLLSMPFDADALQAIDDKISSYKAVEAKRVLAARALSLRKDAERAIASLNKANLAVIDARAKREQALQDAHWPVEGVTVGDDGEVLYHGLPLSQSSSAELVRLSCELALSSAPELRVLLVREGALLDKDSLEAMREVATRYDAQVWIERVGTDESCTVVIEDGEVMPC